MQQAKVGENFIAIKKFSPYDRQSFTNELMIMKEKQDSNLLCLLGYIDNPVNNQLWLLTEYMPLGEHECCLNPSHCISPQFQLQIPEMLRIVWILGNMYRSSMIGCDTGTTNYAQILIKNYQVT